MLLTIIIGLILILLLIIFLSTSFFFSPKAIFLNKSIKVLTGENLEDIVPSIPGRKLFIGNNLDLLPLNAETAFLFFRNYAKKFKKSYLLYIYNYPAYNITTPEDAEHVLHSVNILEKSLVYYVLRTFLGSGLLISSGEKWHSRRKLLTPAFHFNILEQFLYTFKEETKKFLNILDTTLNEEDSVCLTEVIPKFTLNNVCRTTLGVELDNLKEGDDYRRNIDIIEEFIIRRSVNIWFYRDLIYKIFGEKTIYDKYVEKVHEFSSNIIKKRRSNFVLNKTENGNEHENIYERKKQRYAMLDTLLAAEANGQNINHEGICEEVDTFMFEGYDTTSVGLMFSIMLIGLHQDVQEKILEEILNLTDDITTLTVLDFNKLKYLDCVIKESLRLYPSVPFIARMLPSRMTLGNLSFPQYTTMIIHIFDIHRNEKHYPNPEKFDPDRFLPENSLNRHPYAYLSFSAGPRNCIGQKFALLEMKVLLANLVRNYKIIPITKREDITFISGLVLKTKNPIYAKFEKRHL